MFPEGIYTIFHSKDEMDKLHRNFKADEFVLIQTENTPEPFGL